MTNLLHVTGDPLSRRNLHAVLDELEQTAVAVSVTGTSRHRLDELFGLVQPIADSLVGSRPETARVRSHLRRTSHDLKHVELSQRAERTIRAVSSAVAAAMTLVKSGLGAVERDVRLGTIVARNVWGYSDDELGATRRAVEHAAKELDRVGLVAMLPATAELSHGGSRFASFMADRDAIDLDPARQEKTSEVLEAVAERIWLNQFRSDEYETWGGKTSARKFIGAFVRVLLGRELDRETAARLQTTVGRLAARWPEVA